MSQRLTKTDITIQAVITLSRANYKREDVDNKLKREKIDIVGCKLVFRRGLVYNRSTKTWEQSARELRFDFIVKSDPTSYKKNDDVSIHRYPVTFLLKDYTLGMNSPFRWRTGGLKKWKNGTPAKRNISEGKTPEEKEKIRKEKEANAKKNRQITNQNIKNGLQANFIFTMMWVARMNGLLFGPLTCKNQPPDITNPKKLLYFDKTALYIAIRILPRILGNPKLNQVFAKPSRMA